MHPISLAHRRLTRTAVAGLCAPLLAVLVAGLLVGCSGGDNGGGKKTRAKPAHLVELATAAREALAHRVERTGTLRARREAKLYSQEEGAVVAVPVHEGDSVPAGGVLVRLDDRVLKAQLDQAVAKRRQAQADLGRLRRLYAKKLVSEETLARSQTALEVARAEESLLKTRLGYMTITAPFAGRVAQRLVNVGDVTAKHTHLITFIDPTSLITDVSVSELLLPRLRLGDAAEVRIDALGNTAYPGRILRIYPTVDPSTRRGRLEVELTPVPDGASAGQFCRVILSSRRAERLVIPLVAVRRDQGGEFVYTVTNEDKADRAAVHTGLRLGDQVEVLSGLKAGQRVVVAGFLGLSSGMRVKDVAASARSAADKAKQRGKKPGESG
jgi:RND family efflux transporter MFP subunit